MKYLTEEDLESLAFGAAILGSGGGGAPSYNLLMTQHMVDLHGPIRLLSIDELKTEDLVAPIAFIGAPLAALEKFPSGCEYPAIFKSIKAYLGRTPTVLMPAEIGGANAFTPLWVGAMLKLPVLDADTIGRAFPELQMSSCTLHGVPSSPGFIADALGNAATLEALDAFTMERMSRHLSIAMGSRAAAALYLMDGLKAKNSVVPNSVSRAISIGKALLNAKKQRRNPTEEVLKAANGAHLGQGQIADVDHRIEGGFLKGMALIETLNGKPIELHYQNEYLIAYQDDLALASTPDILMLLEQETGTPVTSSELRTGIRVDLVALDVPNIWKSKKGLALVSPRYFGYEVDYRPIIKKVSL